MGYAIEKKITGKDIKLFRAKSGMTQKELADFINVSKKTVERWESDSKEVTGPVVTLLRILFEKPSLIEYYDIPEKKYPLRLFYMKGKKYCTLIDVDDVRRIVSIKNFTDDPHDRAFGNIERPEYKDYKDFLESRCFPKSRDKMKLILRELNLPFYDPFMIIQKTEGRMADDDFHIVIER